jgi:uncharacterized membrane protein
MIVHVRSSLWFVPVACVAAGAALSLATLTIDRRNDFETLPSAAAGDPDVAIAILSTIALAMVSLATLVLTITMVVVQLAMGQFSPRIVQTFLQDKPSQIAVGLFVATFAHAMVSLREVRVDDGTVPGLAIVVAYVLVLASITVLVLYVDHIGKSLRVASLVELVGGKARGVLDQLYPPSGVIHDPPSTITSNRSGVVNHVDLDALVKEAETADVVLELVPAIGDFVPAGAPMLRVDGEPGDLDRRAVTAAVVIGLERTIDQDLAYAFRMLVDIAERSLAESPFQDPTTAVQAIDRLHDCLRQLASRPFPDGRHRDASGTLRLVVPTMGWDAFVHLAFTEIRLAGARSPQVTRRLRAALDDLLSVAPPDRRGALRYELDLLTGSGAAAFPDRRDRSLARRADSQGLGVDLGVDSVFLSPEVAMSSGEPA